MKTYGILYLHSMNIEESVRYAIGRKILDYVREQAKAQGKDSEMKFLFYNSQEDFRNNFQGNWTDWAKGIAGRVDHMTKKPLYHMFIVSDSTLGAGNGQAIISCLAANRPCYYYDADSDKLTRIKAIETIDPNDYRAMYRVSFSDSSL